MSKFAQAICDLMRFVGLIEACLYHHVEAVALLPSSAPFSKKPWQLPKFPKMFPRQNLSLTTSDDLTSRLDKNKDLKPKT
jgi:hypothetical protein